MAILEAIEQLEYSAKRISEREPDVEDALNEVLAFAKERARSEQYSAALKNIEALTKRIRDTGFTSITDYDLSGTTYFHREDGVTFGVDWDGPDTGYRVCIYLDFGSDHDVPITQNQFQVLESAELFLWTILQPGRKGCCT